MVVGHDRRQVRHEETKALILAAAWDLAERDGLGGLSLGELGRAMDMRPQSLYTYFESKRDIYDAMYKQGFEELLAFNEALDSGADPVAFLPTAAEAFVDFAAQRPSRYQLLFQRGVPGFEPTEESYAVARRVLAGMEAWLRRADIATDRTLDLWRALLLGLAGEQLANDPGGQRWRKLAEPAVRYFVSFARSENGEDQ